MSVNNISAFQTLQTFPTKNEVSQKIVWMSEKVIYYITNDSSDKEKKESWLSGFTHKTRSKLRHSKSPELRQIPQAAE